MGGGQTQHTHARTHARTQGWNEDPPTAQRRTHTRARDEPRAHTQRHTDTRANALEGKCDVGMVDALGIPRRSMLMMGVGPRVKENATNGDDDEMMMEFGWLVMERCVEDRERSHAHITLGEMMMMMNGRMMMMLLNFE
jgi:hypothetical protein